MVQPRQITQAIARHIEASMRLLQHFSAVADFRIYSLIAAIVSSFKDVELLIR